MLRRHLLLLAGGISGLSAWSAASCSAAASEPAAAYPVTRTDAEWRRLLTPQQYAVLRQSATEAPFSNPLLDEHRPGRFGCAGCERALFSSETKFDSGTGWPSFWAPLRGAVGTTRDTSLGLVRTAVHCAGCGGHLGHVFDDGPPVTGLRYCINGTALTFKPLATPQG